MAETFTPITTSNLTNQTSITTAIDNNFATIATLLEDVLSLEGNQPNAMRSVLDMNSNQIINLPAPTSGAAPARLQDLGNVAGSATNLTSATTVINATTVTNATTVSGSITNATTVSSAGTVNNATTVTSATTAAGPYLLTILSASHTVQTTESGAWFYYTGGATVYTVSVPSASGFADKFSFKITNGDTRGKTISVTGHSNFFLYPTQSVTVTNNSGTWLLSPIERWVAPNVTFYVNESGSDGNDGLASGASNAFATIDHAWNIIKANIDCAGEAPIIMIDSGSTLTVDYEVILSGQMVGFHFCILTATASAGFPNSTNAHVTFNSGGSILVTDYATVIIQNIEFASNANNQIMIVCNNQAQLEMSGCIFGSNPGITGTYCISCIFGQLNFTGDMSFSLGSSTAAVINIGGSSYANIGNNTYTMLVTSGFTQAWLLAIGPCFVDFNPGITWSGSGAGSGSTGLSINAQYGAFVETNSNTIPGASGTLAANGGYII